MCSELNEFIWITFGDLALAIALKGQMKQSEPDKDTVMGAQSLQEWKPALTYFSSNQITAMEPITIVGIHNFSQ